MWIMAILLVLTSCGKIDYIDTTNLILTKQSKKISKEEDLGIWGLGGAMQDKVTSVTVHFTAERRVDVDEARRLIIRCIEKLRNALNSNVQINEYLSPYPFPTRAMDVTISFINKSGGHVEYGCVWLGTGGVSEVYQLNGKLNYASYNPKTDFLEDYYEEPYEVALEIVEKNGFLNTPCNL